MKKSMGAIIVAFFFLILSLVMAGVLFSVELIGVLVCVYASIVWFVLHEDYYVREHYYRKEE